MKIKWEWIGGNIDTTPSDIAYDSDNDYLFVVEMESVHRIDSNGKYDRFGYRQGAPVRNTSTISVNNGAVYVGSKNNGFSRMFANINNDDNDPWKWQYYYGSRYLPSNNVIGIINDNSNDNDDDKSVFIITSAGITYLQVSPWTYEEKAEAMVRFQYPRHDRNGITVATSLSAYGDVSSYTKGYADNDGLWTAMSAIGFCYWSLLDPSNKRAQFQVSNALNGLELLFLVAENYPYYPARTACKANDGNDNDHTVSCTSSLLSDKDWHNSSSLPGWFFKSDTSSDEIAGHLAALPIIYDSGTNTITNTNTDTDTNTNTNSNTDINTYTYTNTNTNTSPD
jgi:hypothetical protein